MFGDLAGSRFWNFRRILSVPSDPVPSSYRLPDEFDAVCPPTALLQADANVSWFGAAFGNAGIGVALGTVAGIVIGTALSRRSKDNDGGDDA